jgi:rhodanese-related sulfurtransferase
MSAIGAMHRALAVAGIALATLAAAVGTATVPRDGESADANAGAAFTTPRVVGARELAAWIRDGDRPVRVLDLRGDSAYASRHVPSSEPVDLAALDTLAKHRGETLVLYSDDDVRDTQAWANLSARGHERAYVLSGGLQAWTEEVMEAALHGDSADYVAALSRYFGGTPRPGGARVPPPSTAHSPGERPAIDAFGEPERRGC